MTSFNNQAFNHEAVFQPPGSFNRFVGNGGADIQTTMKEPNNQSLELLVKKERGAGKMLKVETKICAIWGILEASLKHSSTLKSWRIPVLHLHFAFTDPSS